MGETSVTTRAMDGLVERFTNASANQENNDHEASLLTLSALYSYSYEQNGQQVSFEAGDKFILLDKSSEDWWHVRNPRDNTMLYIPANYVCTSTDFGEDESSESLNSQGDTNTLSPSSESSGLDYDIEQDEQATSFGSTTSNPESDEIIYANIPITAANVKRREATRYRHNSSGDLPSRPRPKSATLPANWVVHTDDNSGRKYYVNTCTQESSWKPPRSPQSPQTSDEESTARHSSSGSLPKGWKLERQESVHDEYFFVNETNNEMWRSSKDKDGRTYYYSLDGDQTSWELPVFNDANESLLQLPGEQKTRTKLTSRHRMSSEGSEYVVNLRQKSPQLHLRNSKSASMLAGVGLQSVSRIDMSSFLKAQQRRSSDGQTRNSLVVADEFPPPPLVPELNSLTKKEGTINRKKLCERNGRKIKKPSWSPCYIKLSSTNMIIYKNQGAAAPKPGFPHGRPESSCDLRGAILEKMPDENKRRNILQVATVSNLCFLLQMDNVQEFSEWYHTIHDVVAYMKENEPVEQGMEAKLYGDVALKPPLPSGFSSRQSLKKLIIRDGDKKNIRDKLKKLITRRPTMEELRKKGILKDSTFGCHIEKLCARQNTTVPSVVTGCIEAIENKGLDFDGLYRISGNVSLIQQLRIAVDQEEQNVKFGERPFDDVHVLTGTLKLYFRELPEPLFPFDLYDDFINAIKSPSKREKGIALRTQIEKLPSPNTETMVYLFRHLRRVMENSSKNRMHAHNIAIVFGPTLLAPEFEEHGNIALNTVYQNQIIEYILLEYENILRNDR